MRNSWFAQPASVFSKARTIQTLRKLEQAGVASEVAGPEVAGITNTLQQLDQAALATDNTILAQTTQDLAQLSQEATAVDFGTPADTTQTLSIVDQASEAVDLGQGADATQSLAIVDQAATAVTLATADTTQDLQQLDQAALATPPVEFDLQVANVGSATGGTDDFTAADFGTPKAVFNAMFYAATLNTIQVDGAGSFGASDATAQGTASFYSEDGLGTTNCRQAKLDDNSIVVIDGVTTQTVAEAILSNITDGCRYTWSKDLNPTGDLLMANLMFGGSGLLAGVGNIAASIPDTPVTQITSLSFQPDVLIFFSTSIDAAETTDQHSQVHLGFCDASLNQGCVYYREFDTQSTTFVDSAIFNNRISFMRISGAPSFNVELEVTQMLSNGFEVIQRVASETWTPDITFIALKLFDSADAFVGFHDMPTATGNNTITGIPFEPRLVLQLDSGLTVANAQTAADSLIGLSMLMSSIQVSGGTAADHSVGTSDTKNIMDSKAIAYPSFVGNTTQVEGSFVGFTSDGYTINYTKAPGSAFKGLFLAFK